jgi:integrase
VALREKTLWTLAYDSAAHASELLGLDVGDLDLVNRRSVVTSKGGEPEWITWSTSTARLQPRLLKGRHKVPVSTTRAHRGWWRPSSTRPRRHRAAELPAGRGVFQGRHRLHTSSAETHDAHAPCEGRRLGADANDQEPAPVDREPGALRPPIDRGAATVRG